MPYTINDACFESKDMSCTEVCPVDCIYEGKDRLWIHPGECIDCGACEAVCPVEAIEYVDVSQPTEDLVAAHAFFEQVLPGRSEPIGSPQGATAFGPVGVDLPKLVDSEHSG